MDNYTMPDSAFKADKYKTERELAELRNRVQALEEAVRIVAESIPLRVGGSK